MKFQAVIFDFGGVFTTSPVQHFAVFERENNLPEHFIGDVIKANHHTNAWARFERAEMTLEEFDEAFAAESKVAGFEIRGVKLVELLSLHFNHNMIEALARVKAAGYKTGCITNNLPKIDSKAMLAAAEDQQIVENIHRNFDHIIESSKVGVRKPEPRIYEMMCEALCVDPDACIFLDDLGINLKPAQTMGMTTIKVPFGDVTPAIDELSAMLGITLL
ncbi:HAD-IA family hydrolase [Hyphococcus sp.]|uniref:HAD-IA family hydrolase n=1 Tax=Hyphococcus sp. TaxID=2038636 RepID=UPI00208C843B|nr:MAG: phosphoglycolate phosphatase [Marinicaulis sp.]